MTENVLSELGLKTMGAVLRQRDEVLVAFSSSKQGRFLVRVSLGIDSREGIVEGEGEAEGEREGDDSNEPELQKRIGEE